MFKKLINIGVLPENDENLNRRIRIGNVVALTAGISMLGYVPASIYFNVGAITLFNASFFVIACLNFYLHAKKCHRAAFYTLCTYSTIFFAVNAVLFGLGTKDNYFQLVVCLTAIATFETKLELRIFLTLAVFIFFGVYICMTGRHGLLSFTPEMEKAKSIVSFTNLFLLVTSILLFFVFFRNDNISFQKAILAQKNIIEKQQIEMVDSINYAKLIQYALLPSKKMLSAHLPEYFVLFQPKDIVSGDFYWAAEKNKAFYLAACDSTGHGVPGAFMSLLNIRFLNEAVYAQNLSSPNEILNHIRKQLIDKTEGRNDGMDAVLLKLEQKNKVFQVEYGAANMEPVLMRNNQILNLPKDKMPVGKGEKKEPFKLYASEIQKGDILYLFTDGYADQFGGPKGKKIKRKQLEKLLQVNNHLPMEKQKAILEQYFTDWKGELDQVDDILLMAIKFS